MNTALLQLEAISKSFGEFQALAPLDLDIQAGDIVGLVGENGAGKSTLIKILSGVHRHDSGKIHWKGNAVRFDSPRTALDAGIATIHQELEYFSHLSVAENLLLGEEWPRHPWGGIAWNKLHERAREQLHALGVELSTHALFSELTAAEKQEVAIARALSKDAQLLILDEPTASLTEPEVERLFARLMLLRRKGVAVLYVSHRLDEIFTIANRVAVLRDGRLIGAHAIGEVSVDKLVHEMVGRPLDQVYPHKRSHQFGEPLLELKNVSRKGMFEDISFSVAAGEIVGLAGLVGAGRSELARAIYGLYSIDDGKMSLAGSPWKPTSAKAALAAGLVYLPEERKRQGLVLEHSIRESMSIGFSDTLARLGLIPYRHEVQRVDASIRHYDVRTPGITQSVGTLSGGNQQKVMLARWLERDPHIIILDEPTRGIDVGAKAEIHAMIDRLASQGKAILLISSDLPEVLGMSDRVLVMNRGRLAAELRGQERTESNVMLAASTRHAGIGISPCNGGSSTNTVTLK